MNQKQVRSVVSVVSVIFLSVAGSAQAQFEPSDVAGLELWLDASDINNGGAQPADGASLTTWSDKSGQNRDAGSGTGVTFDADGLDGFPTISFAGGTDNGFAATPNGPAPGTGAYSVFTVFQTTAETGWLFFNAESNTGIRYGIGQHSPLGTLGVDEQINNLDVSVPGTTLVNDGAVHVGFLHRELDGGTTDLGVDGTVEGSFGENRDLHTASANYIGSRQTGFGGEYAGDISEVLYYVGEVSDTERGDIQDYLTAKWSGPISVDTIFTWNASGSGDWHSSSNWSPSSSVRGSPPDTSQETAILADAIGSDTRTVFIDSAVTVNSIRFENTMGGSYVLSGGGSFNLDAGTDSMGDVLPTINVLQGTHEFQARVGLLSNTTVDVGSASTLEFNNSLFLNGNTLTKTGEGTIAIRNDLVLGGGTVQIQQGTVSGNGTIGGDVANDGGTISPGNSTGGSISGVPEPTSLTLLALGLGGFAAVFATGRRWRLKPDRPLSSSVVGFPIFLQP